MHREVPQPASAAPARSSVTADRLAELRAGRPRPASHRA
jgi:hypothetical protein